MVKNYLSAFLFISVCLIWGTTWLSMEIAVATIPPMLATGLRFLIAAPILVVLARQFRQPLTFPQGQRKWMPLIAIGYFAIPFTLMIFGEQYISSGLAAIIFANMPVAVMVASMVLLKLRLSRHQLTGLAVAVLSLCLILIREMQIAGDNYLLGTLALATAVALHALMYVLVQKHCRNIEVFTYNALPSLIAAVLLMITSWLVERPDIPSFSLPSVMAVVYLGLFASVGGIAAYFKLNQVAGPFPASICFLVFPLVALGLSSWVSGHAFSAQSLLLMLPLLGGILLTRIEAPSRLAAHIIKRSGQLRGNVPPLTEMLRLLKPGKQNG